MIFVRSLTFDSIYRRPNGTEVRVPHGYLTRYDFDQSTLDHLWSRYSGYDVEDFRENTLRPVLRHPNDADDMVTCHDCDSPQTGDVMYTLGNGNSVGECCISGYWACNDCEEFFDYTRTTLHDTEVCEDCCDYNYAFCDDCEGYYRQDESCGENHNGCECEAPQQRFQIRNGDSTLRNDDRTTVTLPAGTISAEGIAAISRYLREHSYTLEDAEAKDNTYSLSYALEQIGEEWQRKDGNYTKRLSKFAHKTYGLKIAPEAISKIGNIARDHSNGVDFQIEVTRNLNLSAEEFGHEDSCWFTAGSYGDSRCALKSNGGFGLRSFTENNWGDNVTGRAWVMPVKRVVNEVRPERVISSDYTRFLETEGPAALVTSFVPTFDSETADAHLIFNGYGDMSGYAPARIVAHMTGGTYRKIGLRVSPMYINGDSGYLVGAEDVVSEFTDSRVHLDVETHSFAFA